MIRFEHFPLSDTILSIGIFGVNRILIQYFSYNSKSSLAGFILAAVSMMGHGLEPI
ncbi:hypothetical protein [Bacillus sp. SIMBA_033]|uniref:hypothetical protein n=1 Tax=unclassified Bacillus (in: firmicutes) TaxID=185979 RepID=UPI00397DC735